MQISGAVLSLLVVVVSVTAAPQDLIYNERPSDQEVIRQARLVGGLPENAVVEGIFSAADQGGYVYSDGNGPSIPLAEQLQAKLSPEELSKGDFQLSFIRYSK